jgi:hypothetical protein
LGEQRLADVQPAYYAFGAQLAGQQCNTGKFRQSVTFYLSICDSGIFAVFSYAATLQGACNQTTVERLSPI